MGDRGQLSSQLGRARLGVVQWIEGLPQEFLPEAMAALDRLCDAAAKEVEQAYFDGRNHARASSQLAEMRRALAAKTADKTAERGKQ